MLNAADVLQSVFGYTTVPSLIDLVESWSSGQAAAWLKGLDDLVLPYIEYFIRNDISGPKLLHITSDDLHRFGMDKLGHKETVLEAVELLAKTCNRMDFENLQFLAFELSIASRDLSGHVKATISNPATTLRLPLPILSSISRLADAARQMVGWLDRPPFDQFQDYIVLRESVLQQTIQFVAIAHRGRSDSLNDLQVLTSQLLLVCDKIVKESMDPMILETAYLERAVIKFPPDKQGELGFHIQTSYNGVHVISDIKLGSPVDVSAKVGPGDEIVSINNQVVVGWQLSKLVTALYDNRSRDEVVLLLKKRPRDYNSFYSMGQKSMPQTPKVRIKQANPGIETNPPAAPAVQGKQVVTSKPPIAEPVRRSSRSRKSGDIDPLAQPTAVRMSGAQSEALQHRSQQPGHQRKQSQPEPEGRDMREMDVTSSVTTATAAGNKPKLRRRSSSMSVPRTPASTGRNSPVCTPHSSITRSSGTQSSTATTVVLRPSTTIHPSDRSTSTTTDEEDSGTAPFRQRRATISGGSPTMKRLSAHLSKTGCLRPQSNWFDDSNGITNADSRQWHRITIGPVARRKNLTQQLTKHRVSYIGNSVLQPIAPIDSDDDDVGDDEEEDDEDSEIELPNVAGRKTSGLGWRDEAQCHTNHRKPQPRHQIAHMGDSSSTPGSSLLPSDSEGSIDDVFAPPSSSVMNLRLQVTTTRDPNSFDVGVEDATPTVESNGGMYSAVQNPEVTLRVPDVDPNNPHADWHASVVRTLSQIDETLSSCTEDHPSPRDIDTHNDVHPSSLDVEEESSPEKAQRHKDKRCRRIVDVPVDLSELSDIVVAERVSLSPPPADRTTPVVRSPGSYPASPIVPHSRHNSCLSGADSSSTGGQSSAAMSPAISGGRHESSSSSSAFQPSTPGTDSLPLSSRKKLARFFGENYLASACGSNSSLDGVKSHSDRKTTLQQLFRFDPRKISERGFHWHADIKTKSSRSPKLEIPFYLPQHFRQTASQQIGLPDVPENKQIDSTTLLLAAARHDLSQEKHISTITPNNNRFSMPLMPLDFLFPPPASATKGPISPASSSDCDANNIFTYKSEQTPERKIGLFTSYADFNEEPHQMGIGNENSTDRERPPGRVSFCLPDQHKSDSRVQAIADEQPAKQAARPVSWTASVMAFIWGSSELSASKRHSEAIATDRKVSSLSLNVIKEAPLMEASTQPKRPQSVAAANDDVCHPIKDSDFGKNSGIKSNYGPAQLTNTVCGSSTLIPHSPHARNDFEVIDGVRFRREKPTADSILFPHQNTGCPHDSSRASNMLHNNPDTTTLLSVITNGFESLSDSDVSPISYLAWSATPDLQLSHPQQTRLSNVWRSPPQQVASGVNQKTNYSTIRSGSWAGRSERCVVPVPLRFSSAGLPCAEGCLEIPQSAPNSGGSYQNEELGQPRSNRDPNMCQEDWRRRVLLRSLREMRFRRVQETATDDYSYGSLPIQSGPRKEYELPGYDGLNIDSPSGTAAVLTNVRRLPSRGVNMPEPIPTPPSSAYNLMTTASSPNLHHALGTANVLDDPALEKLILSCHLPCKSLGSYQAAGIVHRARLPFERVGISVGKWTKRFLVLKESLLYIYRSNEDTKAEGVIYLPKFTVCPAGPDYKTSKKSVFKIENQRVTFFFYCESPQDLHTWLNQLGLAAIGLSGGVEELNNSPYGYYFLDQQQRAPSVVQSSSDQRRCISLAHPPNLKLMASSSTVIATSSPLANRSPMNMSLPHSELSEYSPASQQRTSLGYQQHLSQLPEVTPRRTRNHHSDSADMGRKISAMLRPEDAMRDSKKLKPSTSLRSQVSSSAGEDAESTAGSVSTGVSHAENQLSTDNPYDNDVGIAKIGKHGLDEPVKSKPPTPRSGMFSRRLSGPRRSTSSGTTNSGLPVVRRASSSTPERSDKSDDHGRSEKGAELVPSIRPDGSGTNSPRNGKMSITFANRIKTDGDGVTVVVIQPSRHNSCADAAAVDANNNEPTVSKPGLVVKIEQPDSDIPDSEPTTNPPSSVERKESTGSSYVTHIKISD